MKKIQEQIKNIKTFFYSMVISQFKKKEIKNDKPNEFLKLEYDNINYYIKGKTSPKKSYIEILKDRLFKKLRKFNIIPMEEYYVEFSFEQRVVEKDAPIVEYLMPIIYRGVDRRDCLLQHNSFVVFIITNFLYIKSTNFQKITDFNFDLLKKKIIVFKGSYNIKYVDFIRYSIEDFDYNPNFNINDYNFQIGKTENKLEIQTMFNIKKLPIKIYKEKASNHDIGVVFEFKEKLIMN